MAGCDTEHQKATREGSPAKDTQEEKEAKEDKEEDPLKRISVVLLLMFFPFASVMAAVPYGSSGTYGGTAAGTDTVYVKWNSISYINMKSYGEASITIFPSIINSDSLFVAALTTDFKDEAPADSIDMRYWVEIYRDTILAAVADTAIHFVLGKTAATGLGRFLAIRYILFQASGNNQATIENQVYLRKTD